MDEESWLPGFKNEANFAELEVYVKDIIKTFANDYHFLLWDLYNEAVNNNKGSESLPLLKKVFNWTNEINPTHICRIMEQGLKDLNA